MKHVNYLNIRKRFSFLFKYFLYVDVPQGYAIDMFEQDHIHFKVVKTYLSSKTKDYVIVYIRILNRDIPTFEKDMQILDKRMEICGFPDYDIFCADFFLKLVTKMSAHLMEDLKESV